MALVNLTRWTEVPGDTAPALAVEPRYVSALIEGTGTENGTCVVRLSDGRGFRVMGTFTDLHFALNVNQFVTFDRPAPPAEVPVYDDSGEDDGLEAMSPAAVVLVPPSPRMVVAPAYVSAVLAAGTHSIIRLSDGRGLKVVGEFGGVVSKLSAAPVVN